ncbi:MAG: hypothetical protein CL933_26090 [Deltaproteobacteria bacterium]|nr:hypothetical protein [Deltaproteobacteria bacterium]
MIERRLLMNRMRTLTGVLCVFGCLLLLSPGVRTVRAEDGEETLMSIDPVLEAKRARPPAAQPPAAVARVPEEGVEPDRPGAPANEVRPGVIVLNTRGYNYGSPHARREPGAMRFETEFARRAP